MVRSAAGAPFRVHSPLTPSPLSSTTPAPPLPLQSFGGLTTFSRSGVLKQVQNALAAVKKGQAALGICATNGVVIACEKNLPTTLIDISATRKCIRIADHIGFVYAGMNPDSRVLAAAAQKKALAYFGMYHERIPVLQLVRAVASTMQSYTQSGGVRPFGVSLLIAGTDDEGPQLYQVDPSGAYFG